MTHKLWRCACAFAALSLASPTFAASSDNEQPQSPTLNPCSEKAPTAILRGILAAPGVATPVEAISPTQILAAGSTVDIVLKTKFDKSIRYRAFAMRGGPDANYSAADAALIDGGSIVAREISPEDPLVKSNTVSSAEATVASLDVPTKLGNLWDLGTLYLFGCKDDGKLSSISVISAPMSSRLYCMLFAIAFVSIAYLLTATALWILCAREVGHPKSPKTWLRYLDPVVMTAGSNGKGNLTKLQILFFSLIVCGLLSFIVMRTGILSELSPKILLLLGIAGVGATAAKATDVSTNRLSAENWVWLIRKNWLPHGGLAAVNQAHWHDIVTTDGEFDVYHFQMLIFSLVVGGALLATGLTNLATFNIPETLLGILGLSQAVYIGGKLASPPSCSDVDKMLTNLRDLESAFIKKVNSTPDPTPPAGEQPSDSPRSLEAAQRRARPDYDLYIKAATDARTLFESVMEQRVSDANLQPDFA